MPVHPEAMRAYRRTALARLQSERRQLRERCSRAWDLARQAAQLLRERYGVPRVVVFGSLVHPGRFTAHSDIDIAAWGLTDANWLGATGAVRNLADDIDLNLVDVTCCTPELLSAIEREGVDL
ncbi:MAG TPA: hypothetical protein VNL77_11555 [Roseiflexaceae bacterium]|nr:hypothetical protein [Roseiflexaceae bacterium]